MVPAKKFNKMVKEDSRLEDVKEILVFPKEKCKVEGCQRNAVGVHDVCERHGGVVVIEQNLLACYEITDILKEMSKYDPARHPMEYIRLSQQGYSDTEIASEFGVSTGTMAGWSEKFADFNLACSIGKSAYEAWWLKEAKRNLDNRNYNTGLFKFITANKLGFAEKSETKSLNVHAGVLMVPTPASSAAEWEADCATEGDRFEQSSDSE